jgi:hypothetical protein
VKKLAPYDSATVVRPFETRIGAPHDIGYNLDGGYGC